MLLTGELRRSALTFETGVLEQLVEHEPDNIEYLAALGQAYSGLQHHERGLAVDRRLVGYHPDNPTFRYNLACSLALTGDLNGACGELLKAIDLGYRDFDHMDRDEDLTTLRCDPRFGLILDHIRGLEDGAATHSP